ncbi:putative Heterokaryon incompatibility protein [Seiridium cardinale]
MAPDMDPLKNLVLVEGKQLEPFPLFGINVTEDANEIMEDYSIIRIVWEENEIERVLIK